jgi:hypothetical protein
MLSGLHVVLLPELAFSGYTFHDRAAIRPCLEDAEEGPTAVWCQNQAIRLRCSVVCGFPRRVTTVDVRSHPRARERTWWTHTEGGNALAFTPRCDRLMPFQLKPLSCDCYTVHGRLGARSGHHQVTNAVQ